MSALPPISSQAHTSLVVFTTTYTCRTLEASRPKPNWMRIECNLCNTSCCGLHKVQRFQWKLTPSGVGLHRARSIVWTDRVNRMKRYEAMRYRSSMWINWLCVFLSRSISRKWKFNSQRFRNRRRFIFESFFLLISVRFQIHPCPWAVRLRTESWRQPFYLSCFA